MSLVARCHIVEREPSTTSYTFSMTEPYLRGQVNKLDCMNHSLRTNYKPILDHVNDEWAVIVSNIIFLPVKKSTQFQMHTKKQRKVLRNPTCQYFLFWEFCQSRILLYFHYVRSSVRHRRDISLVLNGLDHVNHILRFMVYQNTALFSTFRPSVRHRRDISTLLDILTVQTMKTIYFVNEYHLG